MGIKRSVIIPYCGGMDYLTSCIESMFSDQSDREDMLDTEVMIVNNGTEDSFKGLLQYDSVDVFHTYTNLGFGKGVNEGVKWASGDVICILNSDTVLSNGWLSKLENVLLASDDVGIVAPCTNFAMGVQSVMSPLYKDSTEFKKSAARWAATHAGKVREVNWVVGVCMVMRKADFISVGGFDEIFGLGNSEDIDICFSLREQGKRILINEEVYIHHYGGVGFRSAGLQYPNAELLRKNDALLQTKWGVDGIGKYRNQVIGG